MERSIGLSNYLYISLPITRFLYALPALILAVVVVVATVGSNRTHE